MTDPWAHESEVTLAEYQQQPEAQPFLGAFRGIGPAVQGTRNARRADGFAAFLTHPARNSDVDRTLLVPYFLRYLWEVDDPFCTCEAWRLLNRLVMAPEALAEVARTVLERHPHAALRAALLEQPHDRAPQYLRQPVFIALLLRRAGRDPSAAMRRAALQKRLSRCTRRRWADPPKPCSRRSMTL